MKDDFRCEDNAALIGFLYDDCEVDERERIAAHVAVCAICAGELAALSATRDHLSAWTPPAVQLGFRVNPVSDAPATRWWSRPMPAWAQLAAAGVIFAMGTVVGIGVTGRSGAGSVDPLANAATRAEFQRLEQRLKQVENKPIPAARVQIDDAAREAMFLRVSQLVRETVQESEQRQMRELAVRTINMESAQTNLEQRVLRQGNGNGASLVTIGYGGSRGTGDE
jgi:hypothetical protein